MHVLVLTNKFFNFNELILHLHTHEVNPRYVFVFFYNNHIQIGDQLEKKPEEIIVETYQMQLVSYRTVTEWFDE